MRIALLAFLLPLSTHAAFQSGNALLSDMQREDSSDYMFALGYVAGAFDAFGGVTHCVTTSGVTQRQALLIAKKYLEAHPEELHKGADTLLLEAFKAAFPCGKKP